MKSMKDLYITNNLSSLDIDTIFDCCPDGVICKNSELKYTSVNESYCKIFKNSAPNDFLGKFENRYLQKSSSDLVHDADIQIKSGLYPINYVLNIGKEQILNITSFPLLKNHEFFGIVSIVKDITQEEVLKEKFVNKHFQYIDAEKHLQKQRETFVASVGHDLKNPTIAQIRGVELLLKGTFGDLNSAQKEILQMILDSCRYMNGMLSTLLTTYRHGTVKLNFEQFSFVELINECVSEMLYVARDKGVNLIIENSSNSAEICADKVQIKRVVMNLLSNGIKYAFKDTELKLSISDNTEELRFYFENKSPYIPKDKQKTIFERYVSYAGKYKELGIGLGLYASKKIIEAHNGRIYVQSYEDDRNIFGFNIPVHQTLDITKEICF